MAAYAVGILDLYHAVPSLWQGAAAGRDGRPTQARRWCGWARHRLRHGQPDGVWADLVEALEVEGLPDSTRDTLTALYAYVERHRDPIDSAKDKDLGLPMGSGMVDDSSPSTTNQRPHDAVYQTPRLRCPDPYPYGHAGVAASRHLRENDAHRAVLSHLQDLSFSTAFGCQPPVGSPLER